jgi:hypothetical protein
MTMKKLSPVDREALERAIEMKRTKGSPAERKQIDHMLAERSWMEVATFAAYSCQCDSIHPKLWQPVPCWIDNVDTLAKGDDGVYGYYQAARLLRRMLSAGLSKYEPDPLAALKAAERKATAGGRLSLRQPV